MFVDWKIQYSEDANSPQTEYSGLTRFLSKSHNNFFVDVEKIVLKFLLKRKEIRIGETILKKKEVEEISLLNFKTYIAKSMW